MILIDPRSGSREFEERLRRLRVPCEISPSNLDADFVWEGCGRRGTVRVGVEHKRLTDALDCMTGGRFAGYQLPRLLEAHQYAYLIVEGIWRSSPEDGILEVAVPGGWKPAGYGRRRYMARDFDHWLCSLMTMTNLRIRTSDTPHQSACMIRDMYTWWQKEWDDHSSLHVVYCPAPPTALILKPSLTRRIATQFKHIGWERSAAVEAKFRTPLDMALALQTEWEDIPGIGKGIAASVIRQWQGEEE